MKQWWPLLLGAGGITAFVLSMWQRIQAWIVRGITHAIVINDISWDLGMLLVSQLARKCRRSKYGVRTYDSNSEWIRPLDHVRRVVFRMLAFGQQIFWNKPWPIWVRINHDNNNELKSRGEIGKSHPIRISYIRGTLDFEQLVKEALEVEHDYLRQTAKQSTRYFIRHLVGRGNHQQQATGSDGRAPSKSETPTSFSRFGAVEPLFWTFDEIGPPASKTALDMLSLGLDLVDVVEEIRFWRDDERWYKDRGIPWTRKYLFHGKPGTGKTALARALAQDLDLPIFVFNLASMNNAELIEFWREMLSNVPCMALIEDFDGVFEGRRNIVKGSQLTFDTVLNSLDGVERADGALVVITTNNLDKVDPAIAEVLTPEQIANGEMPSRPGRSDRLVEFHPLDEPGRRKMALRIVEDAAKVDELVRKGQKDSAAQFQERCFRVALVDRWRQRPTKPSGVVSIGPPQRPSEVSMKDAVAGLQKSVRMTKTYGSR